MALSGVTSFDFDGDETAELKIENSDGGAFATCLIGLVPDDGAKNSAISAIK